MLASGLLLGGCGTTKWTDTKRTATEQLLISDATDRAVSDLDFRAIAGKAVFLDTTYIKTVTDAEYVTSAMRQHLLASGCLLMDTVDKADYVVEVRSGAVGTDRHELLFGVPAITVPTVLPFSSPVSSIPEIPIVKKTDQLAVAKIAVFAYNRRTGRPVWQSGAVPAESRAKDLWVFGAGPFQRGTIYNGTKFAGGKLKIPLIRFDRQEEGIGKVAVADPAYFAEPDEPVAQKNERTEVKVAERPAPPQPASPPAPPGNNSTAPPAGPAPAQPAAAPPSPPGTSSLAPPPPAAASPVAPAGKPVQNGIQVEPGEPRVIPFPAMPSLTAPPGDTLLPPNGFP
jgi:hypothetical protein